MGWKLPGDKIFMGGFCCGTDVIFKAGTFEIHVEEEESQDVLRIGGTLGWWNFRVSSKAVNMATSNWLFVQLHLLGATILR